MARGWYYDDPNDDPITTTLNHVGAKIHALGQIASPSVDSAAGPGIPSNAGPGIDMTNQNIGAGTIDDVMNQKQKILNMYNQASQDNANEMQQPNAADYQNVAKPFQALKDKIQSKPAPPVDIRNTLQGPVEVTPELQQQLGYDVDDEENTKKTPRQFSTPTT